MKKITIINFNNFVLATIIGCLIFPFAVFSYNEIEFVNILSKDIGSGQIRIEWTTNIDTSGEIIYGYTKNDLRYVISENKNASKRHVVEIRNLDGGKKYYYQIIASNGTNLIKTHINEFEITNGFKVEKQIPKIKDLKIDYISETAASIRWKTDVLATSFVEYGFDAKFGKKTSNNKKTKDHLVVLKNLNQEKQYYIKVYSYNNNTKSSEHYKQFYTLSEGQTNEKELTVSNFRPNSSSDSSLSATFVTVSFITNNLANGSLTVKKKNFKTKKITINYNTKHHIAVMDLSPDSCYDFYLNLKDIFGKKYIKTYNICTHSKNSQSIITGEDKN